MFLQLLLQHCTQLIDERTQQEVKEKEKGDEERWFVRCTEMALFIHGGVEEMMKSTRAQAT